MNYHTPDIFKILADLRGLSPVECIVSLASCEAPGIVRVRWTFRHKTKDGHVGYEAPMRLEEIRDVGYNRWLDRLASFIPDEIREQFSPAVRNDDGL